MLNYVNNKTKKIQMHHTKNAALKYSAMYFKITGQNKIPAKIR